MKATEQRVGRVDPGAIATQPAAGNGASGEPSKVTVPVSGMTCAACTSRVQRALEKSPGVKQASVNLMTNNAVLAYDSTSTSPDRLVEVIRGTGYEAELASPNRSAFEQQESQGRAQEEEFRELRLKAFVSFLLAMIGMIISMPVMSAPYVGEHGDHAASAGDPFMQWVHGASTRGSPA